MSYVDSSSRPSAGSMAAVVAIHAAVGVALIYGMAVTGIIPKDRPIVAIPLRDPPPPPPETPQPPADPQKQIEKPIVTPMPPIPLPIPQPTVGTTQVIPPPLPPIPAGQGEVVEKFVPKPTPSFPPVQARPRNDPGLWIGTDDYRSNWLRQEWAGRAAFRLEIAADGRVTGCNITASTGHPDMDAATCALIQKRARFQPGRGSDGAPTASTYSGSVVWQIPD